jgi:Xaa-Pro dipeptidase
MHLENLDRSNEYFRSRGVRAALLANPFSITWLTGYAPPIQTGPNPFEGGPALGWWREGELTLVMSDGEAAAAEACGAHVRRYVGFTLDHPLAGADRQAATLRELLGEHASLAGTVDLDMDYLSAAIAAVAHDTLGRATLKRLDGGLDPLRAVKTSQEIAKLRHALELCDLAQALVRQQASPGITELEMWGALESRLEAAAGTRLPILADLVGGARTAEIGGLPTSYRLQAGDPLILDVVPRLEGYWGDNAATYFAGQPSAELAKVYGLVQETLYRGIDAVHPGLRANELDTLLRENIRRGGYEPYPHHSGHGLGAAYHEEPRLVPRNDMVLEAGMVIAIEPGIYLPGNGGVRLEHTVLVTADGCEVMTRHLT